MNSEISLYALTCLALLFGIVNRIELNELRRRVDKEVQSLKEKE